MRRWVTILALLLLTSCGRTKVWNRPEIVVESYPDLSNETQSAINKWNEVLDKRVFIIDGRRRPNVLVNYGQTNSFIGMSKLRRSRSHIVGGEILIRREIDRNILLDTLIHEFGHILGIPHSDDPNSIMYPYITFNQQITQHEVQRALITTSRHDNLRARP